jgi:hypothetical protein
MKLLAGEGSSLAPLPFPLKPWRLTSQPHDSQRPAEALDSGRGASPKFLRILRAIGPRLPNLAYAANPFFAFPSEDGSDFGGKSGFGRGLAPLLLVHEVVGVGQELFERVELLALVADDAEA